MNREADFHTRAGFTLVELLLAMTLMTVLALLASYGFSATMQREAITSGAEMVRDTLAQGRASAVSQNQEVEVRMYQQAATANGGLAYNAVQLHWLRPDGTTPAVVRAAVLSPWAIMASTPLYSTLIGSNVQVPSSDPTDRLLNSATRVFHFLPDGSTDLAPGTTWSITIWPSNNVNSTQLPSNWACVVVDAVSGRPQIYRP